MVETTKIRVAILEGQYASLEDHGVPLCLFAIATARSQAT